MTSTLPTLSAFDDLTRCVQVLIDGTAEDEFLKILRLQEKLQLECLARAQEAQRIQSELETSLQSLADLENKLFHARRLLEMETKARRDAEYERDQMEQKILAITDLLQYENNLNRETKDKLAFLHSMPRKRKSHNPHLDEKYGNDINSTGSFLSNFSITQSEDDMLDVNHHNRNCYKQPPDVSNSPPVPNCKRSRLNKVSMGASSATRHSLRRCGFDKQNQQSNDNKLDFGCICATTTVTIPQDINGAIRAESTIETVPAAVQQEDEPGEVQWRAKEPPSTPKTTFKHATVTPRTPFNKPSDSPISNQQMMFTGTLKRPHNFTNKTFLKADTCIQCQKK